VTYPIEFVKTQLQLQVRSSALYAGTATYTSPLDVFVRTLRTSGIPGVYNGGAAFFLFAPPLC
jgi:hypothetical protein